MWTAAVRWDLASCVIEATYAWIIVNDKKMFVSYSSKANLRTLPSSGITIRRYEFLIVFFIPHPYVSHHLCALISVATMSSSPGLSLSFSGLHMHGLRSI